MKFYDLKRVLDRDFAKMTKAEFVAFCESAPDPKVRVGGPSGKGRLTAKRALALLNNG